jgi:transcriptional regulator with XRE-family HTH domain
VDDSRVGSALRAVRLRRGWRQVDLAQRVGISDSTISAIERGHVGATNIDTIRRIARELDVRVELVARWRGGELDRLLNKRHASLTSLVIQLLRSRGWEVAPEVSFSVYGERGWIDVLAWHAPSRTLLVVEVKTELVDVHETLGVLDRKRRLAPGIGRDRGWAALNIGAWLVLRDVSTNRHRVHRLEPLVRAALPSATRAMNRWLRSPSGPVAALTFLPDSGAGGTRQRLSRLRSARRRS